ncbi:hypothetical protein HQ550_00985 [bacterium]|nr:hypothetical protein [bacterium]
MQDNLGVIIFGVSAIAILVVAIRQNLFQDVNDMVTALRVGRHNVEYQFSPDRRRPLVIMDKEFGLRQLHPVFFNTFDKEDWQEFWDIIYGVHPLISFKNEKIPVADRNYSITEIQMVLIERYPEGFSGFGQEHWKTFWKEVFGIIDYKIQVPGLDQRIESQKDKSDRRLDKKIKKDDQKISATVSQAKREIGE